jgi:hypothetical protein
MRGVLLRLGLVPIAVALGTAARGAPVDHCVACHENAVLPITLGHSFADWRTSPHGRADLGCEKCHGGDPGATTADDAHKGVLPADNPDSRVAPRNLPGTCGGCHTQELDWYNGTVHSRLLKEKHQGATCFTCHGALATGYPTPRELAEGIVPTKCALGPRPPQARHPLRSHIRLERRAREVRRPVGSHNRSVARHALLSHRMTSLSPWTPSSERNGAHGGRRASESDPRIRRGRTR